MEKKMMKPRVRALSQEAHDSANDKAPKHRQAPNVSRLRLRAVRSIKKQM